MMNRFCALAMGLLALPSIGFSEIAIPVITDINDEAFGSGVIGVDTTAVTSDYNNIAVYTMIGGGFDGAGFGVSISNGENGVDSTEEGANTDVMNDTPLDAAIAAVNGGGRLQNGNAIRFSAWFQQDPNDPISLEPQVEPVLKLELWKEYGSGNGDFSSGRKASADFGDRLWDTDINAPDSFWDGFNQSEASRIDLNNSGDIANGDDLTVSLPPTTSQDEWVLVETYLVIDDTPDNAPGFGWEIGDEQFFVDAVEEIRGTMFLGDYTDTDLSGGGSFYADNIMLEVFATEADMLSTPNSNPRPSQDFVPGDYNDDGVVDAADYTTYRANEGMDEGALPNDIDGGVIGGAQLATWESFYGDSLAGEAASAAVPEPSTVVLACLGIALLRRRR